MKKDTPFRIWKAIDDFSGWGWISLLSQRILMIGWLYNLKEIYNSLIRSFVTRKWRGKSEEWRIIRKFSNSGQINSWTSRNVNQSVFITFSEVKRFLIVSSYQMTWIIRYHSFVRFREVSWSFVVKKVFITTSWFKYFILPDFLFVFFLCIFCLFWNSKL